MRAYTVAYCVLRIFHFLVTVFVARNLYAEVYTITSKEFTQNEREIT